MCRKTFFEQMALGYIIALVLPIYVSLRGTSEVKDKFKKILTQISLGVVIETAYQKAVIVSTHQAT